MTHDDTNMTNMCCTLESTLGVRETLVTAPSVLVVMPGATSLVASSDALCY